MINFKFVKSQFKNVIVPLIILIVILLILIVPSLGMARYFTPTEIDTSQGSGSSASKDMGAIVLLSYIYFGVPGIIVLFTFSLILSHILVSKEIDRGYLASWLTTPMSRRSILNSKLFVLLSSLFLVYFLSFLLQSVIFVLVYRDFNAELFGRLALYHFALILMVFFWASINWIFVAAFNKPSIAISVASGVSIFFILCATMVLIGQIPGFEMFQNFKYASITSFLNSPFQFDKLPIDSRFVVFETTIITAKMLPINILDFAWQLPLMFVLISAFFPLGNCFVIKKDLHL